MSDAQRRTEIALDEMAAAIEVYQKDQMRPASAQERLSQLMGTWGMTFNIMAALAAPRVLAKLEAERETLREQMTGVLADYVELITGEKYGEKFNGDDVQRTLEPTRRALALLEQWGGTDEAPPLLVQTSRDFFAAFGWTEPDCGWDAWEGTSP